MDLRIDGVHFAQIVYLIWDIEAPKEVSFVEIALKSAISNKSMIRWNFLRDWHDHFLDILVSNLNIVDLLIIGSLSFRNHVILSISREERRAFVVVFGKRADDQH